MVRSLSIRRMVSVAGRPRCCCAEPPPFWRMPESRLFDASRTPPGANRDRGWVTPGERHCGAPACPDFEKEGDAILFFRCPVESAFGAFGARGAFCLLAHPFFLSRHIDPRDARPRGIVGFLFLCIRIHPKKVNGNAGRALPPFVVARRGAPGGGDSDPD